MSFDKSRFTFDPRKDYSGVVMQQGRVQLDSDWNEWLAELTRRIQAGTLDILGRAVYPATTPFAFHVTASSSGGTNVLKIGPGRMYVDGLLAENHGDPATVTWDPALAAMSNTPQPPPAAEVGAIDFTKQPYVAPGTKLPAGNGPFLAYLDVWVRPVDYLNDPTLVDKAVGVDSTGRLQTVWQVRLLDLANSPGATCDSPIANFPPAPSAGLLTTGTTPTAPSGPCCLTSGAAYTGLENQFYRVQIHQPGPAASSAVPPAAAPAGATFTWSRDNGSVVSGVTAIDNVTNSAGSPASRLTVLSLGRDRVLGFAPGHWIEITNDAFEFDQQPGELHQIDTIDFASKTVTLATTVGSSFTTGAADPALHTRIRRWDQSGKVFEQDGTTVWWDIDAQGRGDIPVPPAGTSLILENGITVSFDVRTATGQFVAGDFWTFAARTADGSIEKLDKAAPRGIHHHYARLSIVTFPGSATDCRTKWPPAAGDSECGCCCTCTVGDGVTSVGKYTSINAALAELPETGGEVCVLPGRYFENVLIQGRRDVVIHGCGWQTRIASASLKPAPPTPAGGNPGGAPGGAAPAPAGTFNAVITISGSEHVKLLSFAVEAARDEAGVLVDGMGTLTPGTNPTPNDTINGRAVILERGRAVDITIDDLIITGSTLPAILAHRVVLLDVENTRVAMENVRAKWPAVWISGRELRVARNWLGIQSATVNREWLPVTVARDLGATAATLSAAGAVPLHPGGIQIAGPAIDVLIEDNEIDGAGRNGITLGGIAVLGGDGRQTGDITGVTIEVPGPCDTKTTLTIPGGTTGGDGGGRTIASGMLRNIQINHNRIRTTGLCGIGPVGFFDFGEAPEVISIENLTIDANTIESTLLSDLTQAADRASAGYGAICVPSVENLVIRDNAVTDFGRVPGDPGWGIFVLHGERVDISRNHVLETRDWRERPESPPAAGSRGGIALLLVTPPTFKAANSFTKLDAEVIATQPPVYLPGLPALRVEHNTVRVPLGQALHVVGFGPFSIVNNHLATGGTVATDRRTSAETVLIANLSLSLESQTLGGTFSQMGKDNFGTVNLARASAIPSCGAVIFTNNTCQLEARLSRQRAVASIMIVALDDLVFGHNECWVDGRPITAIIDALLLAGTVQATSNRFQEAAGFAVLASAFTIGALNITSQNISTYCLFATGTLQPAINNDNLTLMPVQLCQQAARDLKLNSTN